MSDTITVLKHPTNKLAKTWRSDGTIAPYDDAKYFSLVDADKTTVDSIDALSRLLTRLAGRSDACIIRGRYVGDERARAEDLEYREGKVRRTLACFEDQPLHVCLIDVDTFEPLLGDPVLEPERCIDEYIASCLPECFHGAAYHWQLSNSAGAPGKTETLRAHIWFWLARPFTSAQLRAWGQATWPDSATRPIDLSMFNPVQIHYTAAPVFESGVVDPLPVRQGFVPALLDDEVGLEIPAAVLAGVVEGSTETRQARLRNAIDEDPIVSLLQEQGLVKSRGTQGEFRIECPCSGDHSGEGGPSSTIYYPPNTGGYSRGAFVCLHDHCRDRPQREFQLALGYDDIAGEFTNLDAGDGEALIGDDDCIDALALPPEAEHLTSDLCNAQRLMEQFKNRLMVTEGRWFAWVGTHWAHDEGEVYRKGVRLSKIITAEAEQHDKKALQIARKKMGVGPEGAGISMKWLKATAKDKKLAAELPPSALKELMLGDALRKWAARSEMRATIDSALYLVRKMVAVPEDRINADPWAFNCKNGTVDLRTGEIRPHRPSDYITHCCPLDYNAAAEAPAWAGAIAKITGEEGLGTKPLASFLQRWFGYCATGSTREQKFVVHHGSGRNGKSTILDTMAEVFNGYAGTAAPGLLVARKNESHPTEIADLHGRRMVTAHENDEGGVLREGFIKQATGGDRIKARYMRGDFFEFAPTHKLQLLTNHRPVIKGQDAGIWGRVLLVPYQQSFGSPAEVAMGLRKYPIDYSLEARIKEEYPGILAWVVQGAVQWYAEGLNPPDTVLAASRDYQTEQDRVLQFITDRCEVSPTEGFETPLAGAFGGLYPSYQEWCHEGGIRPLSKQKFSQEITRVVPYAEFRETKREDEFGSRRKIRLVWGVKLCEEG